MSEVFYICEWCPEECCGKRKEELQIVDGKRLCEECIENEYSEEPAMEKFIPQTDKLITQLQADNRALQAQLSEVVAEKDALKERVGTLVGILAAVQKDLRMRGEKDSKGILVIDIGGYVWNQLCDALRPPTTTGK